MSLFRKLLAWFCAMIVAASCHAGDVSPAFTADLPVGWIESDEPPPTARPKLPTRTYKPADGRNAKVLVSAGNVLNLVVDREKLDRVHAGRCQPYLPKGATNFELARVPVAHGVALISVFTDPDLVDQPAKPGNYKHATVVDLLLDENVWLAVTIFTDEREGETFDQALQLVKSLAPRPKDIGAITTRVDGDDLVVFVPRYHSWLRIPREFRRVESTSVRSKSYFYFSNPDHLLLSGWIEPAERFLGFDAFWASEKKTLISAARYPLEEEAFFELGPWRAVTYVGRLGDRRQWNLRACCTQGDTWVDVHLSTLDRARGVEALKEMLGRLKVEPRIISPRAAY